MDNSIYTVITKGDNIYFVSTTGSASIVLSKFYINGKKAAPGQYTLNIKDGTQYLITVEDGGIVVDKQIIPGEPTNEAVESV